MKTPDCGVRDRPEGPRCTRPASSRSAIGQCESHRRMALYRAWASGWPKALPYAVKLLRLEDET